MLLEKFPVGKVLTILTICQLRLITITRFQYDVRNYLGFPWVTKTLHNLLSQSFNEESSTSSKLIMTLVKPRGDEISSQFVDVVIRCVAYFGFLLQASPNETIEFPLNVLTEFSEFSDKNIVFQKIIQTCSLLCNG